MVASAGWIDACIRRRSLSTNRRVLTLPLEWQPFQFCFSSDPTPKTLKTALPAFDATRLFDTREPATVRSGDAVVGIRVTTCAKIAARGKKSDGAEFNGAIPKDQPIHWEKDFRRHGRLFPRQRPRTLRPRLPVRRRWPIHDAPHIFAGDLTSMLRCPDCPQKE